MHQATLLAIDIRTRTVNGVHAHVRLCTLPQVRWCPLPLITPLVWRPPIAACTAMSPISHMQNP